MKRIAAMLLCLSLFISLSANDAYALDILYPNFNSLSKYEDFISRGSVPRDFVHISQLRLLGNFSQFYIQNGSHRAYTYVFSNYVDISINHDITGISAGWEPLTELPPNTSSMMTIKHPAGKGSFCYFRNGLYYTYSKSELQTIEWFASDIHFKIHIAKPQPTQYKNAPIINRLLSTSEAEADAAISEICESAGLKLQTVHYRKVTELTDRIIRVIFIGAIVSTVVGSWILAKRRRARGIITQRSQSITQDEPPISAFLNHDPPIHDLSNH